MAKYYCDYGIVKGLGEDTIKNANEFQLNTSTYDDAMKKDLLEDKDMYEGKSRDAFDIRVHDANGLVNGADDIAKFGDDLGKHVISAASTIKGLDTKLAQLKI